MSRSSFLSGLSGFAGSLGLPAGRRKHYNARTMIPALKQQLKATPVIPLIQAEDSASGIAIARALAAAGMPLVEVVQRTDASLDALKAIASECPDLIVGAGTVLSDRQAEACIDAGAGFIVSPGLDDSVVGICSRNDVPALPGIMTPTEVQRAIALGLDTVKFFPASIAGGTAALKALGSVFRTVSFVPTGGISASNLAEYLSLESVLACGGSWMTPAKAIADGDFDSITALAAEALVIAGSVSKG